MKTMTELEAAELAGRMYEDIELADVIQCEQMESVDAVLTLLRARAAAREAELREAGKISSRCLSMDEFEQMEREVDEHLALVAFAPGCVKAH